jgi:hypothetical protein
MKKTVINTALVAVIVMATKAYSQGFANLDFEHPILPLNPVFNTVSATNAIPHWSAYYSTSTFTNQAGSIAYDTVSAGGALIILEDSNAPGGPFPIQGSYSVFLEGASGIFGNNPTAASIGQTGTIPSTAQSLTFYLGDLFGNVQVSFNGQPLSFMAISNTLNYTIYGADISAYAGQTGQLLFTAPLQTDALLDNIQFSSLPVPEPSAIALSALGTLFLGFRRWRNSSR